MEKREGKEKEKKKKGKKKNLFSNAFEEWQKFSSLTPNKLSKNLNEHVSL